MKQKNIHIKIRICSKGTIEQLPENKTIHNKDTRDDALISIGGFRTLL